MKVKSKSKSSRTDVYVKDIDKSIRTILAKRTPATLYEPARYLFQGGGKRLRAVMTVLACGLVDNHKKAYSAAAAVELLHNFSLIHDDIMDNDDLRRGRETIHKKWNTNVAILSGDLLVALAYQMLSDVPSHASTRVSQIFTEAFVGLCEGQALDKEYEKRTEVKMPEYMNMIELKTAGLFRAATHIGAVIGKADGKKERALLDFGYHCGMAFQIQDDLLDVIADEATLGKDVASDLMEGKKSYLAILSAQDKHGKDFVSVFQSVRDPDILKRVIDDFRKFLIKSGIRQKTEKTIQKYMDQAFQALDRFKKSAAKEALADMLERIASRQH